MHPFKTKLAPNFKIDWGEDYPESSYPERKAEKIQLFDLKKYVTEEKNKQRALNGNNNGLNIPPMGGFNPYNPAPMPPNPFANSMNSFNNLGGVNHMPNTNPYNPMGMSPNSFGGMNNNFNNNNNMNSNGQRPDSYGGLNSNIDEMMKDIDRRLKELDEEEAREKERMKIQMPNLDNPLNNNKDIVKSGEAPIEKPLEKPKVNIDVDSVIVNENVITDDEFFDDFFGEDE